MPDPVPCSCSSLSSPCMATLNRGPSTNAVMPRIIFSGTPNRRSTVGMHLVSTLSNALDQSKKTRCNALLCLAWTRSCILLRMNMGSGVILPGLKPYCVALSRPATPSCKRLATILPTSLYAVSRRDMGL